MNLKRLMGALFLFVAGFAQADSMQCLEIKDGTISELELRAPDGQMNCFYLEGISSAKQINLLSKSIGNFGHKVKFFEIDQYGQAQPLSTWTSDAQGLTSAQLDVLGRKIGFSITPTTDASQNKHL